MSDYYTPNVIIVAARNFFENDTINIDLCSDHVANTIVKADRFLTDYCQFSPRDEYNRSLWCNPPYQRDFITPFFEWYAKHIPIAVENGCEILTLVNTQSSAKWYHSLLASSDSMAFFKKRISFIDPETLEPVKNNRYDQTLFMSSAKTDAHLRLLQAFRCQAKIIKL